MKTPFYILLIFLIIFSNEEIFLSDSKEEEDFQSQVFTTEELGYLGKLYSHIQIIYLRKSMEYNILPKK